MNQEYGVNYEDYPATSIPYWDWEKETCGEVFYDINEFEDKYNKLQEKLQQDNGYNPREYILKNLSINVCKYKLLDLIVNKM